VERDIRNIPRDQVTRIFAAIKSLHANPLPSQFKKLKSSEVDYRLRVGDYRVLYDFDSTAKTVTVYHIRHRKDAYKK
jgi:mRNA interferase RelE/StbE